MANSEIFNIHEFAIDEIPDSCSWIIVAPPGRGKCLDPSTKVLMFDHDGSGDRVVKRAEDIKPGELLMGNDGTPRKVLSTTEGMDHMYKITQSKGIDYIVNGAHILVLKCEEATVTISVDAFLTLPKESQEVFKGYKARNNELSDIKIISLGEGTYCGFVVDGNHQFQLEDSTVTHNSNLIEYIAYVHQHKYPVIKVMSGTEDSNRAYEKWAPLLFISDKYVEDEEKRYIVRQRRCKANGCKNGKAINIIDDCSDTTAIYRKPTFQGLYKNGSRQWGNLIMTGLQYGIDFPPGVRKSTSYVAIGFEPEVSEREKLYKNFGGACGSFSNFCDIMDQLIEGPSKSDLFTFMIIKKIDQGPKMEENVFFLKAPKMKSVKWKFGCKELWKWDKERRDPNKTHSYGLE